MTDYRPIDCGLHSAYELAVMHAEKLRLSWYDDAGTKHVDLLVPADLVTRGGEEFMVALTAGGEKMEIRLDRICDCRPA
jgi:transcriptional antiterminator Rof (Rho-off)